MSVFRHTSKAIGKVGARKAEYNASHAPRGKNYHKAKTRRNAYVTLTAGGASLPGSKGGYDALYANSEGKPDVILESVKITEGSDFGMLRTVEGQFICLSRGAFDAYESSFLRPSTKLQVSYGYVDGSDGDSLEDFVICKYGFQLDDKNRYVCSFKAYGPGPFMNKLDMGIAGAFSGMNTVTGGFYKAPVTTLPQYLKYVAQGNGLMANVDIPGWTVRESSVLVLDNPNSITPDGMVMKLVYKALQAIGLFSADSSKKIYCTLEWLVKTIQQYYIKPNLQGKMKGRKLVCNSTVSSGHHMFPKIGSAYPMSIVLPGGDAGYYGSSPLITDLECKLDFSAKAGQWGGPVVPGGDYSKILISYDYIASKMFGSGKEKGSVKQMADKASQDKNKKTPPKFDLNTCLGTLFNDIYHATGGSVQLATMENPEDSKEQWIVAKNGKAESITETVFDPIQGDGITRKCTVKCDIPADDAYAVANGGAAGGSGHTSNSLASEPEVDENAVDASTEANTKVTEMMSKGLSAAEFDNEDCDALAAAFKTLVDKAPKATVAKGPIDKHIWPLELSITLDGCAGFRFGDVVNTTFLPGKYRSGDVSFVVLEATHEIKGNDWTTELKSQCHLAS